MTMTDLIAAAAAKKAELDRLRAHAPVGLGNFEHSQDLELTYTSNAIEGNTLTAAETTMVIEHGITVGGKPLKDHLEAVDHFEALHYVRQLARNDAPLSELDVRSLHRLVMLRSAPDVAGRYADQGRYVLTDSGRIAFPSPAEIAPLMQNFVQSLAQGQATPAAAFAAHWQLVKIHPFNDGNGRTTRLLMNLLLIRSGYPAIAVRPEDRAEYIASLQEPPDDGAGAAFSGLLYRRLNETLSAYLQAASATGPAAKIRR